jgi:hypothetical protein
MLIMKLEKQIKLILIVVLLVSLLIYHLLGIKAPEALLNVLKDFDSTVLSIGRIIGTVLFLIFTVSTPWVARLFNWGNFIGGNYKGFIKDKANGGNKKTHINIKVTQSIINIKIGGITFDTVPNGNSLDLTTEYVIQGGVANMDTDIYKFIVELEGHNTRNYGLLSLQFEDGVASGFLYESNPAQVREVQLAKVKVGFKKWWNSLFCKERKGK